VRKIGIGIFCVILCTATALILLHLSKPYTKADDSLVWEMIDIGAHDPDGNVDDTNCLVQGCHIAGDDQNPEEGTLHYTHGNCPQCHEGTPGLGNVSASSCTVCHPFGNAGECPLVNFHDPDKGAICLDCHDECEGGETTTTTTVTYTTVKGKRYEVFLVGSFEGCSATTMTFRADNILLLGCIDGYGVYLPILNFFTAVYWAPNFYLGEGVVLVLSGVGLDPFIIAGGIAYVGNDVAPVLITGYLLSTP